MRLRPFTAHFLAGCFALFLFMPIFVAAQQPGASNGTAANSSSSDSTLVGAWIGFAGAVIAAGIAFETYLFRRQSENNSVNRAVRAEIRRLLGVIKDHEKWWAGCIDRGDTNQPLIPFTYDVYKGQVKKIGVLRRNFVGQAVRFYGYVGFLNALQGSKDQYAKMDKLPDFDKLYHRSLLACIRQFGEALRKNDDR